MTLREIEVTFAKYRGRMSPDECMRLALRDLGLKTKQDLVDEMYRLMREVLDLDGLTSRSVRSKP